MNRTESENLLTSRLPVQRPAGLSKPPLFEALTNVHRAAAAYQMPLPKKAEPSTPLARPGGGTLPRSLARKASKLLGEEHMTQRQLRAKYPPLPPATHLEGDNGVANPIPPAPQRVTKRKTRH